MFIEISGLWKYVEVYRTRSNCPSSMVSFLTNMWVLPLKLWLNLLKTHFNITIVSLKRVLLKMGTALFTKNGKLDKPRLPVRSHSPVLQNGFKKRYKRALTTLAAVVANFQGHPWPTILRETPDSGPYLPVSRLESKISRITAEVCHFL